MTPTIIWYLPSCMVSILLNAIMLGVVLQNAAAPQTFFWNVFFNLNSRTFNSKSKVLKIFVDKKYFFIIFLFFSEKKLLLTVKTDKVKATLSSSERGKNGGWDVSSFHRLRFYFGRCYKTFFIRHWWSDTASYNFCPHITLIWHVGANQNVSPFRIITLEVASKPQPQTLGLVWKYFPPHWVNDVGEKVL